MDTLFGLPHILILYGEGDYKLAHPNFYYTFQIKMRRWLFCGKDKFELHFGQKCEFRIYRVE